MTTIPVPAHAPQPRTVALRPLALPTERGGWGFLFEPIVLGLLAIPSWSGALIAVAAVFGFLSRQPLKFAMQDAVRGKRYPRTRYCRLIAAAYLLASALALTSGVTLAGALALLPFAFVAPLAIVQLVYDARNRSRELIAEMSGAAAMSSVAAAIAIAGGMAVVPALGLAGIIIARALPSILYVRTLLRRTPAWPVIAVHAVAIVAIAIYASPYAIAAMAVLLLRAVWGVTHEPPRIKTIGWREIVFGAITVTLAAMGVA
ncbi:MAG: YwiC-like family protein [Acidobacteriota bacterium]|nr:YwiC-like family protein [Acidobacteriota bacterium]